VNGSTVRLIFCDKLEGTCERGSGSAVRCVALCAFIGSVMALSLRFLAILLYTILLPAAVLSFSISNGGVLQRSSDGKPLPAAWLRNAVTWSSWANAHSVFTGV
jgi:hypothetical protein